MLDAVNNTERPVSIRGEVQLSRAMSALGQKQAFRSAIACPSLSVLTSYSLFGD
jgi:hypothetical protein